MDRWHITRERGNIYTILVVKPEGKRRLDRPRNKWESSCEYGSYGIRLTGYRLD